jgi:hypothetical protein
MSLDADQLYALLPAVYRTRDAAGGGQLRALFGVLAAQSQVVDDSIDQLYDDQFIETCAPWVIPYIGDLIGYNSVYELAAVTDSRAEVAHTIGYRRRKGTLIALEQLAIDVSGRAAVVVEEFRRLITTESMRLVRPGHDATVNLRDGRALALLGTAFEVTNRTIDVRRIAPRTRPPTHPDTAPADIALHGPGRANIPDVAIHLWRWQAFPVTAGPARALGGGRYTFSPLGNDIPLFSPPRLPAEAFGALLTRGDVPQPIPRCELADRYGADGCVLLIADGTPIAAAQVCCANLSDRPGGVGCSVPSGMIAIDTELGRIQYAADLSLPTSLQVTYWYGFPGPIGGGPYDRSASLATVDPAGAGFFAIVGPGGFATLESAVAGWNTFAAGFTGSPGPAGVIVLPGCTAMTIDVTGAAAVTLPPGASLSIVTGQPDPAVGPRTVIWNNALVTLTGDIAVTGTAATVTAAGAVPTPGQLLISGIWLAGRLLVSGEPCGVQVADSTLVPGLGLLTGGRPLHPGEPSVVVTARGATLALTRVITGPVAADPSGSTLIRGSVVDATAPCYVAYAGPDLASPGADFDVEGSTVVGKVQARTITLASNTIFHARLGSADPWQAAVWASRLQAGCVRFCVLPYKSITPRRYECLPPDQASQGALEPHFVTLRYGDPSYALLSGDCPMAVWTGADNGSQLGVYLQIQETEAIRNVALRAPEYLPARMESGIFLHPARARQEELRGTAYGYGYGQQGYGFTGIGVELI